MRLHEPDEELNRGRLNKFVRFKNFQLHVAESSRSDHLVISVGEIAVHDADPEDVDQLLKPIKRRSFRGANVLQKDKLASLHTN